MNTYAHLNHYISPSAEAGLSDAWRRSLGRLGDYSAILIRSLNLRPLDVSLYTQTEDHILVRISLPSSYLILRVAPEDDLAAYVYQIRALSGHNIPAPKIIQRDLSRSLVPFAFTLESYVPGVHAEEIHNPPLLRGAGRQAGRALRRMHCIPVTSAGRPTASGRWPQQNWRVVLRQIGRRIAAPPADALIFSSHEQRIITNLLDSPMLECQQPMLIHGRFSPRSVRCTSSGNVHLEALIDPGHYIGGDGLYDLACGLCAAHPEAWREGLLDGYQSAGPLSEAERRRLPLLQLLANYWEACRRYMYAEPHEAARTEALRLMEELVASERGSRLVAV
ncbi:aminoglycoside phosphotransferase family protein [Candidatus Oscillochloris fontis]|uniref:aminoglycoside phosphotransferase family protein n=1 Tax=Candidatus Oscillochloris fontis TaxID=2496868 RepID=UPI00101D1455|nr:aminoglycoside phosphotransferase family protein [Candidatus Oscillochloris fontis]